jgi:hypothetical protein
MSGCDLCKQGLMGVDIFNGSTVGRVMGVGLVKITPNCIFPHRLGRRIRLRMRRRWVVILGSICRIRPVRKPCRENIFQKDLPPFGEVTIN